MLFIVLICIQSSFEDLYNYLNYKNKVEERFGAGEGIRTLDPNLGKVMLYP